jgi:hypothetical protein
MQDDNNVNPAPDDLVIEDGQIKEGQSLIPKLEEDNDPPFSPPSDSIADTNSEVDARMQAGPLDPTHQVTDNATDIDSHQLYDEGLAGAAEANEPNAGNAVLGYDPENDSRRIE